MIIRLKHEAERKDTEILIRYAEMTEELKDLITLLKSHEIRIKCRQDNEEKIIPVSELYYIESVDKKTFLYGKEVIYQSELRLYQLKEHLETYGFLQISKSCILNIHFLVSIKTLPSSRMEATLKNGERLLVNRKYLADIRKALEGDVL